MQVLKKLLEGTPGKNSWKELQETPGARPRSGILGETPGRFPGVDHKVYEIYHARWNNLGPSGAISCHLWLLKLSREMHGLWNLLRSSGIFSECGKIRGCSPGWTPGSNPGVDPWVNACIVPGAYTPKYFWERFMGTSLRI